MRNIHREAVHSAIEILEETLNEKLPPFIANVRNRRLTERLYARSNSRLEFSRSLGFIFELSKTEENPFSKEMRNLSNQVRLARNYAFHSGFDGSEEDKLHSETALNNMYFLAKELGDAVRAERILRLKDLADVRAEPGEGTTYRPQDASPSEAEPPSSVTEPNSEAANEGTAVAPPRRPKPSLKGSGYDPSADHTESIEDYWDRNLAEMAKDERPYLPGPVTALTMKDLPKRVAEKWNYRISKAIKLGLTPEDCPDLRSQVIHLSLARTPPGRHVWPAALVTSDNIPDKELERHLAPLVSVEFLTSSIQTLWNLRTYNYLKGMRLDRQADDLVVNAYRSRGWPRRAVPFGTNSRQPTAKEFSWFMAGQRLDLTVATRRISPLEKNKVMIELMRGIEVHLLETKPFTDMKIWGQFFPEVKRPASR